jgi:hypothetical protein
MQSSFEALLIQSASYFCLNLTCKRRPLPFSHGIKTGSEAGESHIRAEWFTTNTRSAPQLLQPPWVEEPLCTREEPLTLKLHPKKQYDKLLIVPNTRL